MSQTESACQEDHRPSPPRVRTSTEPSAQPKRSRPVVGAEPVRAVIVDDNDHFVDHVSRLLVEEGLDVVGVAGDRGRGLRLIADLCPDVVFVDICLGPENGLDLVSDLASSGLAKEMLVVLLSSSAVEELRVLFEHSDADDYLPKMYLSGDAIRDILGGNGHK
jgi:CheY-like chemotaxis protein